MTRWHFSIRAVLLGTLVVAVGCATLANPSPVWTGVLLALTAQALLFAAFRALSPRVSQRAVYVGFLAGCLGYLVMANGPWFDGPVLVVEGPAVSYGDATFYAAEMIEVRQMASPTEGLGPLPSTKLLERLRDRIQSERSRGRPRRVLNDLSAIRPGAGFIQQVESPPYDAEMLPSLDVLLRDVEAFFHCGHLILSWLAGLIGGVCLALICAGLRRARGVSGSSLVEEDDVPPFTPAADAE